MFIISAIDNRTEVDLNPRLLSLAEPAIFVPEGFESNVTYLYDDSGNLRHAPECLYNFLVY